MFMSILPIATSRAIRRFLREGKFSGWRSSQEKQFSDWQELGTQVP
jgi:hypothetical protein